jgi:hypothetical protein
LHGHLSVNLRKLLLELGDATTHYTAVGLNLALTGSATGSRTSSLTLKVGPHTSQTRQHILILRKLYLRLCIGCAGARHKDVED